MSCFISARFITFRIQSSHLGTAFDNLPARRLSRFRNASLRSSGGPEHLLLYAHAKQRPDQLLGFEYERADKLFGIARFPGNSRAKKGGILGMAGPGYGADRVGRATPKDRLLSLMLYSI